mgnify:CR=1 FL=1
MTNEDLINLAVSNPSTFTNLELDYISNFVEDEEQAISWVKFVGLFHDRMERYISSEESKAKFARYVPDKDKKKRLRNQVVNDDFSAFIWGLHVPEDRDKVRDQVRSPSWVYQWAKLIGDAEEMIERVDSEYWKGKIRSDAMGEDVSFHHF